MTRADFAIIHPLRYSLGHWMALRSRISELKRMGAHPPSPWQRLESNTDSEFLFSRRLQPSQTLIQVFQLLAQEAGNAGGFALRLDAAEGQPSTKPVEGLMINRRQSFLILRDTGDCSLVTLIAASVLQASPALDRGSSSPVQSEIRTFYRGILDGASGPNIVRTIARSLGNFGAGIKEADVRKLDILEDDNAHILTLVGANENGPIALFARVHDIEEGNSKNQCEQFGLADKDGSFIHFGWSYSTIVGIDSNTAFRVLMPLIAIQGIWYRYKLIRSELISSSRHVDELKSDREVSDQLGFYSKVAFETRIWDAENDSFERALKPTYAAIYEYIWAYWDIDKSRSVVMEAAGYLRDMLDRRHERAASARSRMQSGILFVIAIMQLGSFYGIIQGYLSFVDQSLIDEQSIYDSSAFYGFTIFSPIILLFTIAALIVYFYRRLN